MSLDVQTADVLHKHLTESFKREVDADEAIWRSLPLFGALIALAVAVLPTIYRHMAALDTAWERGICYGFLLGSIGAFGIAAHRFWQVIRIRNYRYPPPDDEVLSFAEGLSAFHKDSVGKAADDLRLFLIEELAAAASVNRRNNAEKTVARSQTLLFTMAGFALAFTAEATILMADALRAIERVGAREATDGAEKSPGRPRAGVEAGKADATQVDDRPRGRELQVLEKVQGAGSRLSEARRPAPKPRSSERPPNNR